MTRQALASQSKISTRQEGGGKERYIGNRRRADIVTDTNLNVRIITLNMPILAGKIIEGEGTRRRNCIGALRLRRENEPKGKWGPDDSVEEGACGIRKSSKKGKIRRGREG